MAISAFTAALLPALVLRPALHAPGDSTAGRDNNTPLARRTFGSIYLAERKRFVFWRTMIVVALLDVATKEWARHQLVGQHLPRPLIGDTVRLTLVYNPGAAFGLHVGDHSRWFFMAVTIATVFVLAYLYRSTQPRDGTRVLALGLVMGGAVGNLINRLWSASGVIDFLDIGIGVHRWPTFNLADIGVSVGAVLLAWSLWREDTQVETRA